MDAGTASGITPEDCAERIIAAAAAGKREVTPVRIMELAALYLNRLTPGLFARLLRNRGL